MMKLLLGGTSDSTAILEVLDRLKINVTSSVVTDYGRHLASKYGQPVIQGRLTAEDMVAFIKENDVDEIIDATILLRILSLRKPFGQRRWLGYRTCALSVRRPWT